MQLLLIRHGQTRGNIENHLQGDDDPLTDLGRRQARATADWLARHPVNGQGERDGGNRRQSFRNSRYCQRDGGLEHERNSAAVLRDLLTERLEDVPQHR